MKNKILMISLFAFTFFTIFNYVQATDFIDINIYEEEYDTSKAEEVVGPFVNMSNTGIVINDDILHSGVLYSNGTMDINAALDGVHLIVSADTLTITGKIDNAIIISGNAVIAGEVMGDVFVSAPGLFIKDTAVIHGDIVIVADILEVEGAVKGNLYANVNSKCKVSGTIEGATKIKTNTVEFVDETISELTLITNADTTEISKKYPTATIEGIDTTTEQSENIQNIIVDGLKTILVFGLITIVILYFSPEFISKMMDKVRNHPRKTLVMGVLFPIAILAVVVVAMLLIIFGLGIIAWPIVILYAAIMILCWMLRTLATGMLLYAVISKTLKLENFKLNKLKGSALIFGCYLLVYILTVIPVVNQYINAAMYMLTIGTLLALITKNNNK